MQADLLIVTVTKVESQAVLKAFEEATRKPAVALSFGSKIYRDLGVVNGTSVFMVQSEMGSGGLGAAQQTVQKGIEALSPSAVIMVGIAFGVDDKKQKAGDILVSQRLRLYDLQRVGTDKDGNPSIIARGDRPHASTWLIDRFRSADLDWDESKAKVRFGLILSGEKLVDNKDYRTEIHDLEPEAIGGEMEGAGLYTACQQAKVDWILVKGICDWADGHKEEHRDELQNLAATNAAHFTLHALKQVPLKLEADVVREEKLSAGKDDAARKESSANLKPPLFSGQTVREEALAEISKGTRIHPLIAVEGLAGSGKTFAVSEFAHKQCSGGSYKGAYWHTCQRNETLDELFIELRPVFDLVGTLDSKCKSLISLLHQTESVLIIDEFHDVDPSSYAPLVEAAAKSGNPSTLVLISRTFVDAGRNWPVIGHMEVGGFREPELLAYLQSRHVIVARATLLRLHSKTDGLPLAASLFSTLVSQFNEDPQELLAGEMQKDSRLRKWFDELGSRMTQDERSLLRALSVYESPFNRRFVRFVGQHLGIASVTEVFEPLQRRYLIQRDTQFHWQVHHLIALFASEELSSKAKDALLLRFAEYCLKGLSFNPANAITEYEAIWAIRAVRFFQRAKAFDKSARLLDRLSATVKSKGLYNLFIPAAETQIRNHTDPKSWIDYHLAHCYQITGHMKLAFDLSEKLVLNSTATRPTKRLASLRLYAELLSSVGRFDAALEKIREALSQTDTNKVNPTTYSQARTVEIMVLTELGQYEAAVKASNALLADSNERKDLRGVAVAKTRLGIIELRRGDVPAAMKYFNQAVQDFRECKDVRGRAWALTYLGEVLLRLGHGDTGTKNLLEGLALKNQIGECSKDYLDLLRRIVKIKIPEQCMEQARRELTRLERTLDAPSRTLL